MMSVKKSYISNKYPSNRDVPLRSVESWLSGRRKDDNAEELWRIHDAIYDLTGFVERHPGGPNWLRWTKGTDITEAFECHHISNLPEKMLAKFHVKAADNPRNITLTLEDGGFYKTLKGRVREKLSTLNYKPVVTTDIIHTILWISVYVTAVLSIQLNHKFFAFLSALLLAWTVIASHNYLHRKDNWRMYAFNLSLMNFNDWRVSHAISHHLYPNSFHDLELSMFEPFFCWLPNPNLKNIVQRYVSWIYGPIVYAALFLFQFLKRIIDTILSKENRLYADDLVAFTVPLTMYLTTGANLFSVLKIWLLIILFGSYIFGLIGLNAAHHHPDIAHDGDILRENRDWGIYQLDAVMDRNDLKGSQFLVLTHFGDHALHHLFPTLDHGILPQLYSTLFQTLAEFEGDLRECSWFHHIIGQHQQLARIQKNEISKNKSGKYG